MASFHLSCLRRHTSTVPRHRSCYHDHNFIGPDTASNRIHPTDLQFEEWFEEKDGLLAAREALETKLQAADAVVAALRRRVRDLETDVEDLTRQRDDARHDAQEAQTKKHDIARERDQAQSKIHDIARERDQAQSKIHDIARERDQAHNRLEEIVRERERATERDEPAIQHLITEKEALESDLVDMTRKAEWLEGVVTTLREEVEGTKKDVERARRDSATEREKWENLLAAEKEKTLTPRPLPDFVDVDLDMLAAGIGPRPARSPPRERVQEAQAEAMAEVHAETQAEVQAQSRLLAELRREVETARTAQRRAEAREAGAQAQVRAMRVALEQAQAQTRELSAARDAEFDQLFPPTPPRATADVALGRLDEPDPLSSSSSQSGVVELEGGMRPEAELDQTLVSVLDALSNDTDDEEEQRSRPTSTERDAEVIQLRAQVSALEHQLKASAFADLRQAVSMDGETERTRLAHQTMENRASEATSASALASLREQCKQYEAEATDLRSQLATSTAHIERLRSELSKVGAETARLRHVEGSHVHRIAKLEAEVARMIADGKAVTDAAQAALADQTVEFATGTALLEAERDALARNVEQRDAHLAETRHQIARFEGQLLVEKNATAAAVARVEETYRSLRELQEKYLSAQSELAESQGREAGLAARLSTLQDQGQRDAQRLADLHQQFGQLAEQLADATRARAEAEAARESAVEATRRAHRDAQVLQTEHERVKQLMPAPVLPGGSRWIPRLNIG